MRTEVKKPGPRRSRRKPVLADVPGQQIPFIRGPLKNEGVEALCGVAPVFPVVRPSGRL